MNHFKRYCFIGFLFTAILGTLAHFFYNWSGQNPVIGLVTPVNESTWEHMKLLFFPAVLFLLFVCFRTGNCSSQFMAALSLGILIGTFLIPVIFYTYTGILGYHLLFLDIATFLISTAAAFIFAYRFSNSDKISKWKPFLTGLLILLAVCFVVFTYQPPDLNLFRIPNPEIPH